MIEDRVYARLYAAATGSPVTLDCATFYPVQAQQGVIPPYIVYSVIAKEAQWGIRGSAGLTNTRLLVEVWSPIYREAKRLLTQVKEALEPEGADFKVAAVEFMEDYYDEDVRRYAAAATFSLWHSQD